MKPVPEQQQLAYLRGRIESWNAEHPEEPMEASEEKLALCAGFSDGYPARAFALLRDPVFEEDRLGAASLLERLPEMTAAEISEAAKEYAGEKEERFAGLMRLWFRDVLVLKAAGEERRILFSDRRRALGAAAQSVSYEGARRIWEAQDLYEKRRRANVSGAAALELLLLQARAALRG